MSKTPKPRSLEEIAKEQAVTLFMALRTYLPADPQRGEWIVRAMERSILSALGAASRASPEEGRALGDGPDVLAWIEHNTTGGLSLVATARARVRSDPRVDDQAVQWIQRFDGSGSAWGPNSNGRLIVAAARAALALPPSPEAPAESEVGWVPRGSLRTFTDWDQLFVRRTGDERYERVRITVEPSPVEPEETQR